MRKIEAGYYEGETGGQTFRVYQNENRTYRTLARKSARYGSYNFASSRKERDWAFKIEGKDAVRGFGTMRQAMDAAIQCIGQR